MEKKYKVYKITSPDGMIYIGYKGKMQNGRQTLV